MSKSRKALGRGLSALIPEELVEEDFSKIKEVDINLIIPNPNQPRKVFEEESLNELASSIKKHGIIQPIIVKKEDDIYVIIAGERRFRAANLIRLKTIPCIIRDIEERSISEIALIENLQREDLNPIDEANAYFFMMNRYNITHEELSSIIGKSRVYVTNTLRLLNLDEYVQKKVMNNEITTGHAKAMISLNKEEQIKLVDRIVIDKLNVRDVEKIVKNSKIKKEKKVYKKDKYFVNIEEKLTYKLSTKVKINDKKNKGKIEINYKNIDELNRLLDILDIKCD